MTARLHTKSCGGSGDGAPSGMEIKIEALPAKEPSGLCANCGKRPATERWTTGSFALSRGLWSPWCRRCCIEKALEFARERAAAIPAMEEELRQIDLAESATL